MPVPVHMPITIEYTHNNDQRHRCCIPVLDLYLDHGGEEYRRNPEMIRPYIETISTYNWLDSTNARILVDERHDVDMDAMVLVCYALVSDEDRVFNLLSDDTPVPVLWERPLTDYR